MNIRGNHHDPLARDASQVKHVRTELAILHAVRTGFPQALSTGSPQEQKLAISGVTRALDGMAGKAGPAGESVAALRDAIEAYTRPLTGGSAIERDAAQTLPPLSGSAPTNAIESALGQLQASDEVRLQEPLLAMRVADRDRADPRADHAEGRLVQVGRQHLLGPGVREGPEPERHRRNRARRSGRRATPRQGRAAPSPRPRALLLARRRARRHRLSLSAPAAPR